MKNIKELFPVISNTNRIYFTSGGTTLKPELVTNKLNYYNTHIALNNGADSYAPFDQEIKDIRTNIAKFYDVEAKEIAFTLNASESLNLLVFNLTKNLTSEDEIILGRIEQSSNLLP
jgi:cysteine desulfurase/selenocysteine lyase